MPALICSFCSKNTAIVRKLIAGPFVYVCNECADSFWADLKEFLPVKNKSRGDELIACSFCNKKVAPKFCRCSEGKERRECICVECLKLCQEILCEELFEGRKSMDKAAGDRELPIKATITGAVDGYYELKVLCVLQSEDELKIGDVLDVKFLKEDDGAVVFVLAN